ncbi:MAG: hypothetical protein ACKVP7_18970 [Hyphomicrobiaceae bacterium]
MARQVSIFFQGREFSVAVAATRYKGTAGNDLFILDSALLANAQISAGLGYDTLQIAAAGNFVFSSTAYRSLSGIDALDFSQHVTGTLEVRLSSSMMSQTDAGRLTIVSGAGGIDLLRAGSSVGGMVYVAGIGEVQLDHATNNIVRIADAANVHVIGGNGSDTIYASAKGSTLDGGAGNDTLVAGNGTDTVRFGTGDRADVAQGFDVAHDVVVIEGYNFNWMSEIRARLLDTTTGVRLDLGNGDTLTLTGVTADDLTAANFAGVTEGAPILTVAVGTTAAALNAMLANAGPGTTVVLAAGQHVFDREIVIRHDGVTFTGAGENLTTVVFDYPAGTGGNGIAVRGGAETFVGTAATSVASGSTSITLDSVAGLQLGDCIRIFQANDAAYMAANGWQESNPDYLTSHPFREMIVAIEGIEGNTVTFASPLAFDFAAGLARVNEIDLVTNVRIADMTVTYALGETNAFDFANSQPDFDGTAAVLLDGTRGAVIEHLSILDAASHGLDVRTSLNATVDDILVDGTHNMGTDGNGYGLQIYETFDSSFTGLEIFNMRHAVLFSAWDAEVGNFVHVVDTNRDVNFHGSEDVANTVLVDRSVLAYDQTQNTGTGNGYWSIVSDGGASHTATDIYGANAVHFTYARGHDAADEIHGSDAGAYLNGMNGQDRLIGGAGNDLLVGGLNKDRMTGGDGSDSFLVRVGDNYDTITDFDARVDGDRIVISGAAGIDSYADLAISAVGDDAVIRYGANATITLEGVMVSEISAHCFVFDPTGDAFRSMF